MMMKRLKDNLKNKFKLDGISIMPLSLDIINEDDKEHIDPKSRSERIVIEKSSK